VERRRKRDRNGQDFDIARSKFSGRQALDQAGAGGGWVGRIHSVQQVNLPPENNAVRLPI